MHSCRSVFLGVFLICLPTALLSQTQVQSDPQAVQLIGKAMTALTNGTPLSDATLTGSVTQVIGADTQTGTATLAGTAAGQSRIDFDLGDAGKFSEVRGSTNALPSGSWIGKDGISSSFPVFNCLTDAAWFVPALTSLSSSSPIVVFSYVGLETRGGVNLQHIRLSRVIPDSSDAPQIPNLLAALTTEDIYLEATSLLPAILSFNVHPDDDRGANIPVDVYFAGYQSVNGAMIPFHVQKYVNGSLLFDFKATNVVVNSGVPGVDFAVRAQKRAQ